MVGERASRFGDSGSVNGETLLLRQVHEDFIDDGNPTSRAFRPTPKDQRKLSVYDGDQITPLQSWQHYTRQLNLPSAGVAAVTVQECVQENVSAYLDGVGFPEHAVIDFTTLRSNSKVRNVGKRLAQRAKVRGWLHGPII